MFKKEVTSVALDLGSGGKLRTNAKREKQQQKTVASRGKIGAGC